MSGTKDVTTGAQPGESARVVAPGEAIGSLLRRQAALHPAAAAVGSGGRWTYGELDRITDDIARQVIGTLGQAAEPVLVLMEHGAPVIAILLGLLKAGKLYVALDNGHPPSRLERIARASGARAIIHDEASAAVAGGLGRLEARYAMKAEALLREGLPGRAEGAGLPALDGRSLACIAYTSGSTGEPKGVVLDHAGLAHRGRSFAEGAGGVGPGDRVAQVTHSGLGAAPSSIYGALLHGAALLPFSVPAQGVERLARWIVEERITLLQTVPTVLRRLCEAYAKEKPPALLRCVRIAGEAVLPADVALFRKRLGSQCRLQLVYATTETGTIAQMEVGEGEALRWPLPAGLPVERVAVTIEEAGGQDGTGLGEIVVESGCIHRGYWRGVGCVEELGQAPSWRQHRTGDLGRFRADGILEWHGRADDQVKVRGQRIELAEVEAALRQLPNVREAAAGIFVAEQARRSGGDTGGGGGEQRLAAYLVVQDPRKASIRAWRSALRGILPGGLVPDAFVLLPELPVGAGGKVDRKALPVPAGRERGDGAELRGPRDSAEKVLTEIWEDVLGISGVGRDEDFFALGGDSLLAIAIVARIEAEFGKLPAVSMFLQAGTIELQAAALAQEWESQKSTLVAIQPGGGGGALPTLYCVQNVNGEVMRYADLARELGSGQPLYGLQSPALLGEWPARSLKELARRQAREIVEKHGTAPCHLLGHCVGAYVALEMARELAAMGKPVGLVTIIDTPVPTRSPWNRSGSFRKRFTDRVAHRVRLFRWRIKLAAADLSGKGKALRTGAAWRRFADRAYDDAVRRYRPSRYSGKVLAFLAEEPARPASIDSRLDLVRTYLPDCQTRWVGGTHVGCLRRPYVCAMGRVLGAFLRSGGETPGEE